MSPPFRTPSGPDTRGKLQQNGGPKKQARRPVFSTSSLENTAQALRFRLCAPKVSRNVSLACSCFSKQATTSIWIQAGAEGVDLERFACLFAPTVLTQFTSSSWWNDPRIKPTIHRKRCQKRYVCDRDCAYRQHCTSAVFSKKSLDHTSKHCTGVVFSTVRTENTAQALCFRQLARAKRRLRKDSKATQGQQGYAGTARLWWGTAAVAGVYL